MIRRFLLKKRWLIIVHSALMGTQKTKPSHTRKGEEDWRAWRVKKWLKRLQCRQFFGRERMLIFHHFKKHGPFVPCWSNCCLMSWEMFCLRNRESTVIWTTWRGESWKCTLPASKINMWLFYEEPWLSSLLSLCLNKSNNRRRVATLGSRLWL